MEQFGLAIIAGKLRSSNLDPFTSGTISSRSSLFLKKDELSRLLDLKNLDSLDKFNFGNNLEEGSLINKVVIRGGHHDNESDYTNIQYGGNNDDSNEDFYNTITDVNDELYNNKKRIRVIKEINLEKF